MTETIQVFTIGHSNHAIEHFIELLKQHEITLLVDVRSQPYSQWADQFNRELLRHDLEEAGLHYLYKGDSLGGRPDDPQPHTLERAAPDYARMAQRPAYLQGIDELLTLARAERLVVMCSEGDHHHCHRHLLITQTLLDRDVRVLHIQPDGTLDAGAYEPQQLTLF
jgi:uncharacterized protein (DUF488 family)